MKNGWGFAPPVFCFLAYELLMLHALWFHRIGTQTALFVFFIVRKRTLEPFNVRITLKREDVSTDPVKEEAIV